MDRVFKQRKRFFFSLLSVAFLYTASRPDEYELIQFFELSQKRRLQTAQRVHKIRVFIPEVIYGASNGLLMALLIPWGSPRNDLYGEALRERGTFFRLQVYKRVEISLAEVYERVGKCVISVSKKAQKDQAHDHVVDLSLQENILCIGRSYIFFHLYCYLGMAVNISGQLICFIHIEITTASV